MSNVEIKLGPGIGNDSLHLNGEDISSVVRGFRIDHRAGDMPAVTLDLAIHGGTTVSGKVELYLSTRVMNLLQLAGWTPPNGDPYAPLATDDSGAQEGER